MQIADKIRFLREEILDLDATEFGRRCGVNRRTVYSWENGESVPCLDNIAMIAIVCNVTVNYLMYEECTMQLYCDGINDNSLNILKNIVDNFEHLNKKKKDCL